MLSWIVYALAVGFLFSCAAYAMERAVLLLKAPVRWVWVASMVASLALPAVLSNVAPRPAFPAMAKEMPPPKPIVLRQITAAANSPQNWVNETVRETASWPDPDRLLRLGWLLASGAMVGVLGFGFVQLGFAKSRWRRGALLGNAVYIAEDSGPAVIGLLRPCIVLPHWLLARPVEELELVIAHEKSHLAAQDARLLLAILLLLACMPWNLPMWWQMRRLRRAIEIDCDARVLNSGHDLARYGEVLIAVGQRKSAGLYMAAAMSEPKSFLEYRIRHMMQKPGKLLRLSIAAPVLLGLGLTSVAAQIRPPAADEAAPAAPGTVSINPATLDKYVGFYDADYNGNLVVAITRNGSQLMFQSGEYSVEPLDPVNSMTFVLRDFPESWRFVTDSQGRVTALVEFTKNVPFVIPRIDAATAQRYLAALAKRCQNQQPDPRSKTMLLHAIASIAAGQPDYSGMEPDLVALSRASLEHTPKLVQDIKGYTNFDADTVQFVAVAPNGADIYSYRQQNATWYWTIALNAEGKIIHLSPAVHRDMSGE